MHAAEAISIKEFLLGNKTNRAIIVIAISCIIIQFIVFKYLYPFASYIHGDSFSYIKAADLNLSINTYLIGYSIFLRIVSVFTTSDTVLVAFQYLFIQISSLYLIFTISFFYQFGKVTKYLLFGFMVLNPLFLHLANLVSSDCIFTALSLLWFSLLLWIINRPTTKIILWQAVILFIAFTIRYNALIYPFISAIAISVSLLSIRKKVIGIAIGIILCAAFVILTSYEYKKLTGFWQYSPFSGWQLANNSMYAYRYVKSNTRLPVPSKFKPLDNMIREYFDTTKDTRKYPQEALLASTVYMWTPKLPLYKYRDIAFNEDSNATEFKKWASIGPLYKSYGIYIIKQYPFHFLKFYIWPNALKYYAPPLEFLGAYNSGRNYVRDQATTWFEYKNNSVQTRLKDTQSSTLKYYPILSGIINIIMLFMLLFFLILKGWKYNASFSKGILLGSAVWLFNAGFTIIASSAALRFQSFPILLTTIFVALLLDWLWKVATTKTF